MKKSLKSLMTISIAMGLGFTLTERSAAQSCQTANDPGHSISVVNHLAQSILVGYSYEARSYGRCPHTANLLVGMRDYKFATDRLVRAYYGTCPTTLAKAACDTRTALTRVQTLMNHARVSHQVRAQIQHSCPMVTMIHNQTKLAAAAPAPVPHITPNPVVPHNTHYDRRDLHQTHGHTAAVPHYGGHKNYAAPNVSRSSRGEVGQILLQALMNQMAHRR